MAGAVLVAALAAGCVSLPEPDAALSERAWELSEPVSQLLDVPRQRVPACWNAEYAPNGSALLVKKRSGQELARIIVLHPDIARDAVSAALVHELVHAHVVGQGLSLLDEEGLCNVIAFEVDPAWGESRIEGWRSLLDDRGLDLAWAESVSRKQLEAMPPDERASFYALAFFHVKEQGLPSLGD